MTYFPFALYQSLWWVWGGLSLWFWFAFSWLLRMLSVFSCARDLFKSFALLEILLFVFLLVDFKSSLFIRYTRPLLGIRFGSIFSHSVGCLLPILKCLKRVTGWHVYWNISPGHQLFNGATTSWHGLSLSSVSLRMGLSLQVKPWVNESSSQFYYLPSQTNPLSVQLLRSRSQDRIRLIKGKQRGRCWDIFSCEHR